MTAVVAGRPPVCVERRSELIPDRLKRLSHFSREPLALREVVPELRDQLVHPLLERLLVLLLDRCTDVAAGREREAGLHDPLERRRLAEARLVCVLASIGLPAPR